MESYPQKPYLGRIKTISDEIGVGSATRRAVRALVVTLQEIISIAQSASVAMHATNQVVTPGGDGWLRFTAERDANAQS
jgi:hypothetical protein